MKKQFLLILFFMASFCNAFSQDTIYTARKKIVAKVHEVNRVFVKIHFEGDKKL